jgi:N-acetylglucosamine-6-phosphate deacetylase
VPQITLTNATLILPDRLNPASNLRVVDGVIDSVGDAAHANGEEIIDLADHYLAPGFIDLHVHGGDGFDFMDLTEKAFGAICRCHARHGTTRLTPTSTVARWDQYIRFLELCEQLRETDTGGARMLGGHLYGPYFVPEAKGCHPVADFLQPDPKRDEELLRFAGNGLTTFTMAPELSGVDQLIRSARERGLLVTAGHSYATFPQVEEAIAAGVRHVDHLFCAMSDRARLRQAQTFPMRAGVMEATLYFDELTTEVIADGQHLSAELLKLAYKFKGPDRLALVTDAMRAVDLPDGEYWFGSAENGERVRKLGDVGVTLDGKALASGVMGLDHCIRTFHRLVGAPLFEVIRMATLTPARILGIDATYGSLERGKIADLVVLDRDLQVKQVYVQGIRVV